MPNDDEVLFGRFILISVWQFVVHVPQRQQKNVVLDEHVAHVRVCYPDEFAANVVRQ